MPSERVVVVDAARGVAADHGGAIDGPLTVVGTIAPFRSESFIGFRCAR